MAGWTQNNRCHHCNNPHHPIISETPVVISITQIHNNIRLVRGVPVAMGQFNVVLCLSALWYVTKNNKFYMGIAMGFISEDN